MADTKTKGRSKKPTPPSAIEELPAVWVDPTTLVPWAKNPQKNVDAAVKAVMLSLQRFGQGRTIVARRANREVIAGHKTLIAAINLGWKRIAVRFVDLSVEEAHALAVADNRTAEIAEWDDPLLAEALAEIKLYDTDALAATGFSEAEIDKLITESYLAGEHALGRDGVVIGDKPSGDGMPPEVTGGGGSSEEVRVEGGEEDEEPVVPTDALVEKWKPATGQLWEVRGPSGLVHRLLCGDCRDPKNVERLHEGAKPKLGLHDVPYGIDVVSRDGNRGIGDGQKPGRSNTHRGKFAPIVGDDAPVDLAHVMGVCKRLVLWGANNFPDQIAKSNEWIVWDKKATKDGGTCAETVSFGDGELAYVESPHGKGSVRFIRHLWSGYYRASERDEKRLHPTQKPIFVQGKIIEWYTEPGDLVADWYMGAGAVGLACEKLGRVFHGMDIAPCYIAATLERFSQRGCTCTLVG